MKASSAAKTAQISQFAAIAKSFQTLDFASDSMMMTGMTASVAASTIGSKRWTTRPDSSCVHTLLRFAPDSGVPAEGSLKQTRE
jgi:hypothetical protein